jgi:hypothetical protein
MPYVKTGRPPGRPKTSWYETLSARVPQELADQVRKYAARHRQSLSDVFRDGFTLLLQEDRYAPFMSDTNKTPEILSDVLRTTPAPEIMSDTIHQQRLREIVYDMNEPAPEQEILSDMNMTPENMSDVTTGQEILSDMNSVAEKISARKSPDFDATKHVLGALCKHSHDYHGTGQSLRRLSDNECLECQRLRSQAARQRKRTT